MQILEKLSGEKQHKEPWMNSLATAILVSGRMTSDDWRDAEVMERYAAHRQENKVHLMNDALICLFKGQPIGLARNEFPQSRLEKIYGVEQFTLWSLMGQLEIPEITAVLNQAFPNLPRVTFFNDKIQSVPQIWHVHTMVDRAPQRILPANTVVWAGSQVAVSA